ncbi:unnamed protein product, partial [Closterium sp. NIES-53]
HHHHRHHFVPSLLPIPLSSPPPSQHMMPLLVTGGHTNPNRPFSVVANMSSRTGSISDNHIGGWYSYRASKAALNQCEFIAS